MIFRTFCYISLTTLQVITTSVHVSVQNVALIIFFLLFLLRNFLPEIPSYPLLPFKILHIVLSAYLV